MQKKTDIGLVELLSEFQDSSDTHAYFAADLGPSRKLDATTTSSTLNASDGGGALTPGRYLVQARNIGDNVLWLAFGKFGASITATLDVPSFPMDETRTVMFEITVVTGYNDGVAARMSAATGDLLFTKISR